MWALLVSTCNRVEAYAVAQVGDQGCAAVRSFLATSRGVSPAERVKPRRREPPRRWKTWGELCQRVGMEPGDTPVDTPVNRRITCGQFISSSSLSDAAPACNTGVCCPGGVCGLD